MNELLLPEAIAAIKWLAGKLALERRRPVYVSLKGVKESRSHHLTFVENWSRQVSLFDLPRSKPLSDIFVKLSLSEGVTQFEKSLLSPDDLLLPRFHSILLGHPGAGKTTIIKYLCQRLLHSEGAPVDFSHPILIILRDLPQEVSLIDHLLSLLDIRITFKYNDDDKRDALALSFEREGREKILAAYLNKSRALLLLDGLDEMRPEHGLRVQEDVLRLANHLTTSKFVLTCRIGALEVAIDNSEVLYVCPLREDQIHTFTRRWLGSDTETKNFLDAVSRSPYRDTIGRPLILVNLCLVYRSYGDLPEQPILIYQRVIQLLLEMWDRQRDLRRVSRYGQFGSDRKRQFLGALAYELATRHRASSKYTDIELRDAYKQINANFGLPSDEKDQVVAEVESHTGLLVRTDFNEVEFSHKSLQEYLCADHISRLPQLKKELKNLFQLPNECAVATVLSASPNGFFELLAFNLVKPLFTLRSTKNLLSGFWNPYLTRLLIEGVSFAESGLLGFAILAVATLAWTSVDQAGTEYRPAEGSRTLTELLDSLLDQAAVRASLQEAASRYVCDSSDPIYVEAKIRRREFLPQGMADPIIVHRKYAS